MKDAMCKCGHRKEHHYVGTRKENDHCLVYGCICAHFVEECTDNKKDSIGE